MAPEVEFRDTHEVSGHDFVVTQAIPIDVGLNGLRKARSEGGGGFNPRGNQRINVGFSRGGVTFLQLHPKSRVFRKLPLQVGSTLSSLSPVPHKTKEAVSGPCGKRVNRQNEK